MLTFPTQRRQAYIFCWLGETTGNPAVNSVSYNTATASFIAPHSFYSAVCVYTGSSFVGFSLLLPGNGRSERIVYTRLDGKLGKGRRQSGSFQYTESVKREKGYSAAITAWGHPILANPKEPLNVSFFFLPISFSWIRERTRGTHLCGLGISAARRQLRFPWDFWVIVVITGSSSRASYYLTVEEFLMLASLSIALVHLIYARKPFGSIRFHVRS